jgi:hypothetical protein
MLFTMRKAAILISALAFGAVGLFAQDELATYQASMRAAAAAANGAMRDALTANDTATGSAKAKAMSAAFDTIAAFWVSPEATLGARVRGAVEAGRSRPGRAAERGVARGAGERLISSRVS